MKSFINKLLLFILAFGIQTLNVCGQSVRKIDFTLEDKSKHGAYLIKKVPIADGSIPEITILDQHFVKSSVLISDSLLQKASSVRVDVGVERKNNFALIRIPAFRKNEDGTIEQVQHCSLSLSEKVQVTNTSNTTFNTLRTTATSSVLATGDWQKIAVAERGIYKIDYDFVKNTLGQSGTISSSNIRLFGNGGTMLYEANSVKRPDDLVENPIDIYDGGDGVFGSGDYFLFYANGPVEWVKDSVNQQFHHRNNLYADSSYYFISFNSGNGIRLSATPNASSPTRTITSYNEYKVHEKELVNLGQFGKVWWGEALGFTSGLKNTLTISFPLTNINDTVYYSYQMASAAIGYINTARFTVRLNNTLIGNHNNLDGIIGSNGSNPGVAVSNSGLLVQGSIGNLNFDIVYEKYVSIGKGYLDFIEINTRRQLTFSPGSQLSFRDWRSVGSIAQYEIGNANANTSVWDVTNPLYPMRVSGNLTGSTLSFIHEANRLREYIAFDNTFLTPKYSGKVPNQNLHGLDQAIYTIICHPEMMEAANKLADFHRTKSNYTVNVVPVDQVYNEFSSGAKDISAIRDFMRMFYDRAGKDESKMPRYLLLLGQASYDYKNITSNSAKLVPTYETEESLGATSGYCADDYYAILDSNEDINNSVPVPLMDIGVGRIPATNKDEAMAVVNKIIRYKSAEALGVWRLNNLYLGDNEDDAGNHLLDADSMSRTVRSKASIYRAQKIYLDNMNIISTPGGPRAPEANKVINDNMYKGTFLLNYSGHGSIYALSYKRVVTQDDYNSWRNQYKMPIMITATCDFSRFDNPALQSAGEKIMLKSDGGAIALVTTTQVVFANPNTPFNVAYLKAQFSKGSAGWNTFGEAFRVSKNEVIAQGVDLVNSRKFALLGDPGIIPDFPRYDVETDSLRELVNGAALVSDSVKSLGAYRIYGSVRNDAGNIISDFNGKVNITFFDKEQKVSVKTARSDLGYREFDVQNNIIYKGIATVENGQFSFEFITPKDINYDFGKGKISYYADNGTIDAAGSDTSIVVGGFSDNVVPDEDAPLVRVFMNDSLFKDGGLTGTNSVLYAIITDKSGINVSGNFVGHDLTAVLDDVIEAPYILNDYYETAPNTYQRGYVNFPMTGLSDGIHSLRVKAWDVFNNSGEGKVTFEVMNGKIVKIRNIYNYPNPFREITHFVFEHNHPNEPLKATINIFNTAGSLLRTIEQSFTPTGSNSAEITWDGTGNGGEKLAAGIYVYRIRIATEKNIEDLGYQKVILQR